MYHAAYPLFFLIGSSGGLLVGLIGAGIGPLVVPALMFILPLNGISVDNIMPMAITTSLAIILVISTFSAFFYIRFKTIDRSLLYLLLPSNLLGALIGALTISLLSGNSLKIVFSLLLISLGLINLLNVNIFKFKYEFNTYSIFLISLIIAFVSNILGVSDGILLIPFLIKTGIDIKKAVSIALIITPPVSLIGIIPICLYSFHQHITIPNTFGYIYLPAFFSITAICLPFLAVGINLRARLPEKHILKIFSYFILAVGIKLLLQ